MCFEFANYSQVESFVVPEVRPSCEGTIRGTYFVMSTPLADHALVGVDDEIQWCGVDARQTRRAY